MGHDPTRGTSGSGRIRKSHGTIRVGSGGLTGRFGSGQEVLKLSRVGSGWVGSPRLDPTREQQPDP